MTWRLMVVASAWWGVSGCLPADGAASLSRLESSDPAKRIRAIVYLADRVGPEENAYLTILSALVDRLEDEDEAVRLFAIAGLDRLTGQRFGYVAYHGPRRRRGAVQQWRDYLAGRALAQGDKSP
ncbi:MAG: hypothetical protein ACE5GE_06575 [Phycisphaerae bacterium]